MPAAPELRKGDDHWVGCFDAMASPCEVLIESDHRRDAERILSMVASEAWRIERKFSRYLPDNIVHAINHTDGCAIDVDQETARLIQFADELHGLSDGRFDITSGVLGRVWKFDCSDKLPDAAAVESALKLVGWHRVQWNGHRIRLEPGMQIDFGGIGKEYAVDRAAQLVSEEFAASVLVNFGGDLVTTRPRRNLKAWRVGIEEATLPEHTASRLVRLSAGGLSTSGDSKRYLLKDGVRYGHILNPTTGWPIEGAPRSVTVAAGSCVQAGMISTLAMLEGEEAETFLEAQDVRHWISR